MSRQRTGRHTGSRAASDSDQALAQRAAAIARRLQWMYPDARLELNFSTPLELLVALILAAQCTDERVNGVTRLLFRKYRDARSYAEADPAELERDIHPTGFYKRKARTLISCCRRLLEVHGGKVPDDLEALVQLPGVGRKTANLIRVCAFGHPAIAVDTHVKRVSRRLGLTASEDPDRIEEELAEFVPRCHWRHFTLALTLHGRRVCVARRPRCEACGLRDLCPWPERGTESMGSE